MVTIEKKDIIVSHVIAKEESLTEVYAGDLTQDKITYDECDMILRQLENMGLLNIQARFSNPLGFVLAVNAGLHEFHSRGGFKAQELILMTKLEKLDAEIQLLRLQLEPDKVEQLNKVVSLFASACSMIPYIQTTLSAT